MKRIKYRSLKIAILLVATGSMAILYWCGFHKEFDKKSVPYNADGIALIDVKNIRNYFIFSYLKNPSQWKFNSKDSKIKKRFDFSNYGIATPDYLALFHIQNQPLNQWCFVATIENETKLNKAIIDSHFIKIENEENFIVYYSKTLNTSIIRFANQILYSKNASQDLKTSIQTAKNLFIKHHYFDAKTVDKILENSNAITLWFQKNNLLEDDGIINISLKDQEIIANGQLNLRPKFRKMAPFLQNPDALMSLGFNFEMIQNQKLLKNHSVTINKMIGFNLDSINIHNPTYTEFVLYNIIEKKDSAVTYDYDDDFNPIKKVVVHTNREPSFSFSMKTNNTKKVYDYLKSENVIDDRHIFLNFPLATTKASVKNNSLILEANHHNVSISKTTELKIAYLQMNFNQLKTQDWHFLITKNNTFSLLKPFEKLKIDLIQKNNLGYFEAHLKTANNISLLESLK
ncbi:hypothetical protein [Flavobacterium sp.]|uniref:hypothetical protein n=1 Tax=Flavobacterium sp. TaxID=239 RepID=UPI002C3D8A22|nr:hypothetical protein [Flavobacterium sp.]HSD06119.1 hypothetical protein [Flavobacterium sp.]